MDQKYHETVRKLEEMNTHRDYILGWISGYLHNPQLEEQRVTEAYTAGYADGENREIERAGEWQSSDG